MFIGSVNMITEQTAWEGPQGAIDRLILQALNETKKLNIIIETADFTVLITVMGKYLHYFLASKMTLSEST